ncbi:MAG: hypothetical protein PT956_02685 [Firmicutes bacterium]|nr:hypothetical protein [Bacillota bacterium]
MKFDEYDGYDDYKRKNEEDGSIFNIIDFSGININDFDPSQAEELLKKQLGQKGFEEFMRKSTKKFEAFEKYLKDEGIIDKDDEFMGPSDDGKSIMIRHNITGKVDNINPNEFMHHFMKFEMKNFANNSSSSIFGSIMPSNGSIPNIKIIGDPSSNPDIGNININGEPISNVPIDEDMARNAVNSLINKLSEASGNIQNSENNPNAPRGRVDVDIMMNNEELMDFIKSIEKVSEQNSNQEPKCPNCGKGKREFMFTLQAGCEVCYSTFKMDLINSLKLKNMMPNMEKSRGNVDVDKLKEELDLAIRLEEYERAQEIKNELERII